MKHKDFFFLAVSVSLAACSPDYPVLPTVPAQAAPLTVSDAAYLQRLSDHDLLQSKLGSLAEIRACSSSAKSLGADNANAYNDHRKSLATIATSHHLVLSDKLSPASQKIVDHLSRARGPAFDRSYSRIVKSTTAVNGKNIEAVIGKVSDPSVKSAATALKSLDQKTQDFVTGWSPACSGRLHGQASST